MADTASETGRGDLAGEASSQLHEAAASAQNKVGEVKDTGREKLGEQIDQRTTQVGEQARSMAQALRRSSEQLRTEGRSGQATSLAESAADRMERLGGYLEGARGDDVLRDVERFARRRPWMVAGLGLVAGLAASRFLKASSERRYSSSSGPAYGSRSGYDSPSWSAGRTTDEPLTRERSVTSG